MKIYETKKKASFRHAVSCSVLQTLLQTTHLLQTTLHTGSEYGKIDGFVACKICWQKMEDSRRYNVIMLQDCLPGKTEIMSSDIKVDYTLEHHFIPR